MTAPSARPYPPGRLRRLAAAAVLLTALAAAAVAAVPPGGAAGGIVDRVAVEDADRAFARLARREGTRAAFLDTLTDDAVIFRPGPVAARAFLAARPSPPGYLVWAPVHAEVSAGGDLAYTTGPYQVRAAGSEHAVEARGWYLTVWRKQPDGAWKVVLDQGVSAPPAVGADAAALAAAWSAGAPSGALPSDAPPSGAPSAGAAPGAVDEAPPAAPAAPAASDGPGAAGAPPAAALPTGAPCRSVLAADRAFAADAAAHGSRAAFLTALAPDARLYQEGVPPAVGRDAAARALGAESKLAASWEPTAAACASAGDLGYTYGETAVMGPGAPRRIQRGGVYVRIWRRQGGDGPWKIVLDLTKR